MKKIILLFVVCVAFKLNSYAQQQSIDQRTIVKHSESMTQAGDSGIEIANKKTIKSEKGQQTQLAGVNSVDVAVTKRVSKTDDGVLKIAPPIQRKQIIGNRPIIGNVPLEKYKEEELVPVKVK